MSWFDEIQAANVSPRADHLYRYLKNRANSDGECFPSIATIARETKLSRSTVQRALNDLEKHGFLTREARWRERGARSSNLYHLK